MVELKHGVDLDAQEGARQARKRLAPDEVAQLVAAHRDGVGVKEPARQFGIHRAAASDILTRKGGLRAPGIQPDDRLEIIRFYKDDWSLARLGVEFGVVPGTVANAQREFGVPIKRPGDQRSPV